MSEATGYEKLSLETLGDGHAIDQVNTELSRVIANIIDVNTEATTARSVTLKIVIKPSEDRSSFDISHQATSKLAADHAGKDRALIGKDKQAYVPAQTGLFDGQPVVESLPRLTPQEG